MENRVRPEGQFARQFPKTLRLTFRVAGGEVQLVTSEHLNMICPPSIGERPEAGKNGGFWIELRDLEDRVIFHRVLHTPLGDSVEVHSPDGKIHRVFGDAKESVFEVLLPDVDSARSITVMGESLDPAKLRERHLGGSTELARFDVPKANQGGGR